MNTLEVRAAWIALAAVSFIPLLAAIIHALRS